MTDICKCLKIHFKTYLDIQTLATDTTKIPLKSKRFVTLDYDEYQILHHLFST